MEDMDSAFTTREISKAFRRAVEKTGLSINDPLQTMTALDAWNTLKNTMLNETDWVQTATMED